MTKGEQGDPRVGLHGYFFRIENPLFIFGFVIYIIFTFFIPM